MARSHLAPSLSCGPIHNSRLWFQVTDKLAPLLTRLTVTIATAKDCTFQDNCIAANRTGSSVIAVALFYAAPKSPLFQHGGIALFCKIHLWAETESAIMKIVALVFWAAVAAAGSYRSSNVWMWVRVVLKKTPRRLKKNKKPNVSQRPLGALWPSVHCRHLIFIRKLFLVLW